MNIILLSGGSGKRLWPLSNDVRSKQFIKLFHDENGHYESMLQRVYHQIQKADPKANIVIATSKSQVSSIHNQLDMDVSISIEPCRRDTFPAILLSTLYLTDVLGVSPQEPVVVCPVDPLVGDTYFTTMQTLAEQAGKPESHLVLMGIEPSYPSEKYGYIIPNSNDVISSVKTFKEKPDRASAENYLNQGALWNAGVFAYRPEYILALAHELLDFVDYYDLFDRYETLEKISFDYAVVEKEPVIQVVRYPGEWKDVGTWNTLTEAMDETIIIFIYWLISRLKIDYFYSMIKYSNEYFEESEKLKMDEKAKLLKKPRSNFSYINNFFPQKQEEQIKNSFDERNFFEVSFENLTYIYINWIKVIVYTAKTIYPFIFSFIFLLLSFWSQIFLIIPIFLILNLSENLSSIFLLFTNQALRLFLIAMFFLLILYIFSWFGFFFLPRMFKYEAVDKNNELINQDSIEENICSSTVSCILYFLNFGFRDNLMDMNLFSFKNEIRYYFIQFFFTIFLYAFIHLIFDNIFLATISSAFDEMKEEIDKKDNENENVCFICSKTRNDCMKENKNFEEHLQKHDMWKYIRYICGIILKNKDDYTDEEYYVWKQIKNKNLDWFPAKEEEKLDLKKIIGIIKSKRKK